MGHSNTAMLDRIRHVGLHRGAPGGFEAHSGGQGPQISEEGECVRWDTGGTARATLVAPDGSGGDPNPQIPRVIGGPSGTRTRDLRIKSPQLYRLSYQPDCSVRLVFYDGGPDPSIHIAGSGTVRPDPEPDPEPDPTPTSTKRQRRHSHSEAPPRLLSESPTTKPLRRLSLPLSLPSRRPSSRALATHQASA